jgi:hypothetical protein
MVAEGCTIARGEPTSCNHDNCEYCKAPSAAFHLDLGIRGLLLHEIMRNKHSGSPLLRHMVRYETAVIMGSYAVHQKIRNIKQNNKLIQNVCCIIIILKKIIFIN